MKIIYHHRTQLDDAQGIHIYEMMKAFENLGHQVHLLGLVEKDKNSGNKVKGHYWGFIVKFTPAFIYELMEMIYNVFGYFSLRRMIKRYQPDFIYERYALNNFCGILAAKKSKIPIFLEVNAPLFHEKSLYDKLILKRFSKNLENWICNNASKTMVVTSVLKNILIKQGVNPDNLLIIHNGINPKEFNTCINGLNIKKKSGFDKNDLVIGIIGWFREWHGLDFLITALDKKGIFSKNKLKLLLVGDGPVVSMIQELIVQNRIEKSVIITGAIERKKVPAYIAAMDIAVQPRATSYACPMKIIEYLAMGKAIIAPFQDNITDLLEHGHNSVLFKPEDQNDLLKKIENLIKEPKLRQRISRNAAQTIEDRQLLWSSNAKKVEELFEVISENSTKDLYEF